MSRVAYSSAAPVTKTAISGPQRRPAGAGRASRAVSSIAPSMRMVDTPAPTAASVKATSTASSTTKNAAESRL